MNRRQQGDIGELGAAAWMASKGVPVALPLNHSPDWDLAAEIMGNLVKVQVKTSTVRVRDRCWRVTLCTRGGNRSWNGVTKHLDSTRCDYLFAHVGDGRRWFIPVVFLEARSAVILGGRRYAQFEVEPGLPLPGLADARARAL
jgi:hypothetical protein